jgi:E3 SUMO-protein ligase NSE2
MSRRLLSNAPIGSRHGSARPGTGVSGNSSGSRTSHKRQRQQQQDEEMPEYEPPTFALDQRGRQALAELSKNTTEARKYGAELEKSVRLLGESVAEVNDRYTERRQVLARHLERRRERGGEKQEEGDEEEEEEEDDETRALRAAIDILRREVPDLTRRCDEGVREVIDWMVEMEDSRTAAANTVQEVEQESFRVADRAAAAQARAVRRQQLRERRIESGQGIKRDNDEAEEEEEDQDEEEDADDDEGAEPVKGPLKRLRDNKAQLHADYESKSLYQRYGLNNDYIQFKKLWHDAAHRDGKALPDASKWFSSRGGQHQQHDGGDEDGDEEEGEDDEDDDLIVAREKKDLRCPLSMVMMQEPYTSAKCNHTFEKRAIQEFLRGHAGRTARCPQTGCNQVRFLALLRVDTYFKPLPKSVY